MSGNFWGDNANTHLQIPKGKTIGETLGGFYLIDNNNNRFFDKSWDKYTGWSFDRLVLHIDGGDWYQYNRRNLRNGGSMGKAIIIDEFPITAHATIYFYYNKEKPTNRKRRS